MKHFSIRQSLLSLALGLALSVGSVGAAAAIGSSNPKQSGSTGLQGTISAPAPKNAPTISVPVNGRSFTSTPITVSGLCSNGLLVKLFSNNIFVGSVVCSGGSFSLQVDLFSSGNSLIARQYDALDQSSPDSNTVTVNFQDSQFAAFGERVSLTSQYAKLGADTGTKLTWPIILSGGSGPYAVSVDWGDGSATDLISQPFAGRFDISHVYKASGVYRVTVRVTDASGQAAFLQLVGVGNGKVTQNVTGGGSGSNTTTVTKRVFVVWPFFVFFPFVLLTFWLGKRYELQAIHRQIERQTEAYRQD